MQLRHACGERRASVAVEFALCATFFLLPLYCVAADFITILNAQAQLNTALQALVYYGWTNPGAAVAISNATTTSTETSLISLIDNAPSTFHVTLNAGSVSGSYSNLQYYCVTTTATPYTITANASATCGNGQTLETYVQFTVSTTVILPFPVPAQLGNPYPLSATGSAQVQ
jgi:hypothetical protein